jgi:hypothetical protein
MTSAYSIFPYQITAQAKSSMELPHYMGSALRGAFGYALKKISCMVPHTECKACPLKNSCPYTQIFDPQQIEGHLPTPYIIQPQQIGKQHLQPQQTVSFGFTLIGEAANAQLPLVLYAWQKALERGLGKQRQPMSMQSVQHYDRTIWHKEVQEVTSELQRLSLPRSYAPRQSLELTFKTPVRLQHYKKLIGSREFKATHFMQALNRRFTLLSAYLSLPALTDLKEDGIEIQHQLQWHDWSRYSNRQQQKMTLGGLIGTLTINSGQPLPSELLHAMDLGQHLNLGKNTVFGMGHYQANL